MAETYGQSWSFGDSINRQLTGNLIYTTTTAANPQVVDFDWDEINKAVVNEPIVTACARDGHQMFRECELEDGTLVGMCEQCGELIKGRRLPGGMALAKLRAELEQALGDPDREIVAEEFLRIREEVEAEEKALQEAHSLLRLAEKVLFARSMR